MAGPDTAAVTSGTAVHGASLLILLQVASRAITFAANQLLLRYMTPQLLGISAQLEVYYLSVLFFARESLRVAIQRQGGQNASNVDDHAPPTKKSAGGTGLARDKEKRSRDTQAVVNGAYISIALGVAVALLLGWLYLASVDTSTLASTPYLVPSLYLYASASLVELLSEPSFVVMQLRLRFSVRARAEAVATFLRCTATLSSAVWAARHGLDLGVLPFALGQAAYGFSLLGVYGWFGFELSREEGFSLLPVKLPGPVADKKAADGKDTGWASKGDADYVLSYFYRPTLQLASSMMAQSLVKHVLTQGDTFLVSILSTPTAQGVYALANNYGGLVARLVFQPIEESSRNYFSRLLASRTSGTSNEKDNRHTVPSKTAVRQARSDLQSLLKTYLLFSVIIVTLGPLAAPRLLTLVAGSRWVLSGAGSCLSAYTWYVPLLAVNGVSEAFVASVATESQVHQQSAWMTAFSLAFAAAGFVSLRVLDLGAVGLVWANAINMLCRITWCAVFISRYFSATASGLSFDIQSVLPGPWAVLASVIASQAARLVLGAPLDAAQGSAKTAIVGLLKIAGVALPYLGVLRI